MPSDLLLSILCSSPSKHPTVYRSPIKLFNARKGENRACMTISKHSNRIGVLAIIYYICYKIEELWGSLALQVEVKFCRNLNPHVRNQDGGRVECNVLTKLRTACIHCNRTTKGSINEGNISKRGCPLGSIVCCIVQPCPQVGRRFL